MILRRTRSVLVVAMAVAMSLLAVGGAAAYNEENVKNIQMERLDAVGCSGGIHVVAVLTDGAGAPVDGAQVVFSFEASASGDTIGPTTTASDPTGTAETVVHLSCIGGERIVRASVPGDGSAQIVITCGADQGCSAVASASSAPETAAGPVTPDVPPTGGQGGWPWPLLVAVALAVVGVLAWSRRQTRRPS
jgi:hypothetical protein